MPFVIGETVGQYRILEKLGRGGMATVFKAYHPALDRYVALKALHPAFMEDPNFLARFRREARVVAKLEHPNIVPIYDFAEHEGRPYLVMKYIEGETLKARLTRDPIEKAELLYIAETVGEGLFYAHKKGILHRDVKPSNVLLGFDKRIYLADFGLARIAQAGESTLSSDMMLGTPQYISPEQAMGVRELDEGTDIYSFGVMLYELVVGRVPFSADTPFSIIHDHIYTPLPLPRQINADVPQQVERVLLKALAKERADRYPDAKALVDAFTTAIQDEALAVVPVEDLPGSPTEIKTKPQITAQPEIESPDTIAEHLPDQSVTIAEREFLAEEVAPPVLEPLEELSSEPDIDELADLPTQKESKPRRRFKKWQIIVGVAALVFCCFLGLVAIAKNQEVKQAQQLAPTAALTDQIGQARDESLPENLRAAYQRTEENPEDPFAFLDLAAILLENDRLDDATEAFRKAFVLTQGNEAVVLRGIDMMAERGMWMGLTSTLLVYYRNHPENFTPLIYDRFAEAAFVSAEYPAAEKAIPIERIVDVDEALERVVKARYVLYNGEAEFAQGILDEVLQEIRPDMPEAWLVQAELSLKFDDQPNARRVLTELESRDDIAEWVRAYSGLLWRRIEEDESASADKVAENPNDLWAYLDLLDSSLASGNYEKAENQAVFIMENAGNDPDIYFATGEILIKYKVWQYAVSFYLRSAELQKRVSDVVIERIEMASYFGGVMEDGVEVLSDPYVNLAPELMQIVEARHELYFGHYEVAAERIQTALDEDPFLPQELLLEAERLIVIEEFAAAKRVLQNISNTETYPYWVREEARVTLLKLNQ